MDNLTICHTFVHEKKVVSHNLNYLKHVVTHVTLKGGGDTRTIDSYECMTHVAEAKQSGRASCVNDVTS